jgi:RNA polymerase sigma factor (sigma-70 family)
MDDTDTKLLARYASHHAEDAFAELVRRHLGLVYSAAVRQVRAPQLAEEVAQSAFIKLARHAGQLAPATVLPAWLYQVTRREAIDVVRREASRQLREQIATEMNAMNATDADWTHIEPLLDEAMHALDDTDRTAVLLRYFENKSLREVGATLGTSENAAQKRLGRAVERLREFFAKRGVTLGASGLVVVISANAVQAAPVGLALTISTAAALAETTLLATAPMRPFPFANRLKLAGVVSLVVCITVLIWRRETTPVTPEVVAGASPPTSTSAANNSARSSPFARRSPGMAAAIEVPQRVRLNFRVVDAVSGEGLAGGQVRAAYFYAGGRGEGHNLVTDGNGNAAIPEANEGGNPGFNVFASVEGYVPIAIGFGENAPDEYLLKLEPAAAARGVVVDEQGMRVEGVRLEALRSEDYKDGSPNTDFQTTRVETDGNGRWVYHYIPKSYNEVGFILTGEGYAVTSASVTMNEPESQNVRLVIKRGFAVVGRVTDAQGAPVFEASVKELHNFGHRKRSTVTDGNGEFALLGLSTNFDSRIHIGIQARGMAAQSQWIELREPTNAVQIVLAKGNVFRGRVMDEMGNPIPKVAVRTDYDFKNQIQTRFEWRTETDASGWFEWDSAPAEVICYWFEADGHEVIRGQPRPADGVEHQIILKSKSAAQSVR